MVPVILGTETRDNETKGMMFLTQCLFFSSAKYQLAKNTKIYIYFLNALNGTVISHLPVQSSFPCLALNNIYLEMGL